MAQYRGTVRTFFALLVTALFALAPTGTAQEDDVGIDNPETPTPTTLYMHFNTVFDDMPINTQPPDDRFVQSAQGGLGTSSNSCVDNPAQEQVGLASKEYHTFYGYSTPGYVQYDFVEDGGPRYHKERGISFDAKIDTSSEFIVHWYLETQATAADNEGAPMDPNEAPVVVPNVKVLATMREGDQVSVGHEALNTGAVIASGESESGNLEPNAPNYISFTDEDGKQRHVYEFAIPMTIERDVITRDEAFNIRIDVVMELPNCEGSSDSYFMPNFVRVHTSSEYRPRMDFSVMNPIRIEYIHPQFVGEEMVIHTSFNSPWGNYDVDENEGGIELSIEGPSPANSLVRAAFVQRHHEHHHHQEPVDVSYVWPYKNDGAEKGTYKVDVSVRNDQQTATATGTAVFEIGRNVAFDDEGNEVQAVDQQVEESPGIGALAFVAALGAAALAMRRRD